MKAKLQTVKPLIAVAVVVAAWAATAAPIWVWTI